MLIKISRLFRLSVGGGLLAIGTWVAVPPLITTTGIDAVVNAPLMVLRSPIEGRIDSHAAPGSLVERGAPLFTVVNERLNQSLINELSTERDTLVRRIAALERQNGELEAMRSELQERARAHRAASLTRLDGRIAEAEARLRLNRAIVTEQKAELRRTTELRTGGHASVARLEQAEAATARAVEEVAQAEAALQQLRSEKAALSDGVLLGDGQNDVAYSQQRSDEIVLRQQDI
ncbi:MAG: hypothetical protein H7840_17540 [Alphaproteobacteria bacterium]